MDKAIPLSKESALDLSIGKGQIELLAKLDTKGIDVSLGVAVELNYFLDKLGEKLGGGAIAVGAIAVLKEVAAKI